LEKAVVLETSAQVSPYQIFTGTPDVEIHPIFVTAKEAPLQRYGTIVPVRRLPIK
jgi:hypothetical protein